MSFLESAFSEREVDYLLQVIDANQHIREGQRPRLLKIHGDVADWKKVIGRSASGPAEKGAP